MSATGRGGTRVESDRYMTPIELAEHLVARLIQDDWVKLGRQLRVLEPHAGSGNFVQAVRHAMPWAHITANDAVDDVSRWYEAGADDARVGDFLSMGGDFDLVLGNPPYSSAEAQVRHALALAQREGSVVAFLLRLGFLESQERIAFWRDHPASKIYALSERPSFFGSGTDASAYALFVWQRGWAKPTELEVMSWKGSGNG